MLGMKVEKQEKPVETQAFFIDTLLQYAMIALSN
jgi:hypothetical protein